MKYDLSHLGPIYQTPIFEHDVPAILDVASEFFKDCSSAINADSMSVQAQQGPIEEFEKVFYRTTTIIREFVQASPSNILSDVYAVEQTLSLRQHLAVLSALARQGKLRFRERKIHVLTPVLDLLLPRFGKKVAHSVSYNSDQFLNFSVGLQRIAQLVSVAGAEASTKLVHEDETLVYHDYFDLDKCNKPEVIRLIHAAIQEIQASISLNPQQKTSILSELGSVSSELGKAKPRWGRILAKLPQVIVFVAAVTSMIADSSQAAANLRKAWEVLISTSAKNFTPQPLLPFSKQLDHGAPPSEATVPGHN